MSESIEIGAAPHDEECAQAGSEGFTERNLAECNAFIRQIKRVFGEPPASASLIRKANRHELGTYREVAVCVSTLGTLAETEAAFDYAYTVENGAPGEWDEAAREELRRAGYLTAAVER